MLPGLCEFVFEYKARSVWLTETERYHTSKSSGVSVSPETSEVEDEEERGGEEGERARAVRQKLQANPHLRLFLYATLEEVYATVFSEKQTNLERFEMLEDQKEFEALVGLVKANKTMKDRTGMNQAETAMLV